MKLISWNVNSLRAAEKEFLELVEKEQPEVLMLQEVRAHPDQLSIFLQNVPGYKVVHNYSGKLGYGGTAIYYREKQKIDSITTVSGNKVLDTEGRTIKIEVDQMMILNF